MRSGENRDKPGLPIFQSVKAPFLRKAPATALRAPQPAIRMASDLMGPELMMLLHCTHRVGREKEGHVAGTRASKCSGTTNGRKRRRKKRQARRRKKARRRQRRMEKRRKEDKDK